MGGIASLPWRVTGPTVTSSVSEGVRLPSVGVTGMGSLASGALAERGVAPGIVTSCHAVGLSAECAVTSRPALRDGAPPSGAMAPGCRGAIPRPGTCRRP